MSTIDQSSWERKRDFIKEYVLNRSKTVTRDFNPIDSAESAEKFYEKYLV